MNSTDPSNLSTLDEPSLQTLIDHYQKCLSNAESKHAESVAINKSVQRKLPENVSVRDRLIELQQELLKRNTTKL